MKRIRAMLFDGLRSTNSDKYKYIIRTYGGRYVAPTIDTAHTFIDRVSILNIKAWGVKGYR